MADQPNLSELMKMAQKMQSSMKNAHDELQNLEIIGEAGGGMVKINFKGDHSANKTMISDEAYDEAVEEGKEFLEDLITAAINDGKNKIGQASQSKMSGLTKELGLPEGFKLPTDD